jgi:hypothetical protein
MKYAALATMTIATINNWDVDSATMADEAPLIPTQQWYC